MDPINPSMVYYLKKDQIENYKLSALSGNASAAYKLYKYYSMLTNQVFESNLWLYISAKLGDKIALQNWDYSLEHKQLDKNKIFILSTEQILSLKGQKNNALALFLLYRYYTAIKDLKTADIYLQKIPNKTVSPKLLK